MYAAVQMGGPCSSLVDRVEKGKGIGLGRDRDRIGI